MNNSKQKLEQQLWNIANTLRGKMGPDEFRDFILGFIFYKYLSEKMHRYANEILKPDGIKYKDIDEKSDTGKQYLEAIRDLALDKLGYFLKLRIPAIPDTLSCVKRTPCPALSGHLVLF